MKLTFLAVTGLLLGLAACATPERPQGATASSASTAAKKPAASARPSPESAAARDDAAGLQAVALLDELARVANLAPEQRRRELAALEGARGLDDSQRFQLAALLEREDSSEALERSLKNLNSLAEVGVHAQSLIDLMKKLVKTRIELKQQSARAQELQDKLEQIKALEKSLQQRDGLPKAP